MQGQLRKMRARLEPDRSKPVQYELPLTDQFIALNPLLGKPIKLTYTGRIFCVHCNRANQEKF